MNLLELRFRAGKPDDGEQLLSIHIRSIMELGKGYYNDDELASWAHGLSAERYGAIMATENYEVAYTQDGNIVGFCSTENDEIKGLSIDPTYARQGIGSALLTRAVERLRLEKADKILRLTASLPAVDFYKHLGWQETRRWMYTSRGGLKMLAVDMELAFAPGH